MSHASATIIGNLGRDPETRPAGDGTVTTLSVAVTRRGAIRADDVTTWWRVSVWGKRGETATKHLHKGDPVAATGWPEIEEYTDRDGVKRTTARLRNATWDFVGKSGDAAPAASDPSPAIASRSASAPAPRDDEPPF